MSQRKHHLRKSLFTSLHMNSFFFMVSIRNAQWKNSQVSKLEWKVLSLGVLGSVKDRHNAWDVKKCPFKGHRVEFCFWKLEYILKDCTLTPPGQWWTAGESKSLLSPNKHSLYVKTFTFRLPRRATGFSLFLSVEFWLLCLTLNSTWQVPRGEQQSTQGLHSRPSLRPEEAAPPWPKSLRTPTYPLQEKLSAHVTP